MVVGDGCWRIDDMEKCCLSEGDTLGVGEGTRGYEGAGRVLTLQPWVCIALSLSFDLIINPLLGYDYLLGH